MKLVREYLNEKFTQDSDPISDMGIGIEAKIEKLKKKYPYEYPQEKDFRRISDIVTKSNGVSSKENQLARTMSKLITDPAKAYRRYLAAKQILGDRWEGTEIFLKRAIELNEF